MGTEQNGGNQKQRNTPKRLEKGANWKKKLENQSQRKNKCGTKIWGHKRYVNKGKLKKKRKKEEKKETEKLGNIKQCHKQNANCKEV